jgi:hypothetical protein
MSQVQTLVWKRKNNNIEEKMLGGEKETSHGCLTLHKHSRREVLESRSYKNCPKQISLIKVSEN